MIFYSDHPKWDLDRSYDKHIELLKRAGQEHQGCIREPALPFGAQHCPPDLLHMKKGIISKLLNQVVDWTLLQYREEALLSEMKKHKIPFV